MADVPFPVEQFPGIPRGCTCAFVLVDGRWERMKFHPTWGCTADHSGEDAGG